MRENILKEIVLAVSEILGEGFEVTLKETIKNNNVTLQAVNITDISRQRKIVSSVHIDEMLEEIEKGSASPLGVAHRIAAIYESNISEKDVVSEIASNLDRDTVLKNVRCQLVNRERNKKLLADVPFTPFLDLAVIYRVLLEQGEETFSFVVTKELCKLYEFEEAVLKSCAQLNTALQGFEIVTMASVLSQLSGMSEDLFEGPFPMWILRGSKDSVFGAAVMLYSHYFDTLSRELGSDLYILPSSIYEVIAVPTCRMEPGELREIVECINRKEVLEEDVLSDSVYRYCRESGVIQMA